MQGLRDEIRAVVERLSERVDTEAQFARNSLTDLRREIGMIKSENRFQNALQSTKAVASSNSNTPRQSMHAEPPVPPAEPAAFLRLEGQIEGLGTRLDGFSPRIDAVEASCQDIRRSFAEEYRTLRDSIRRGEAMMSEVKRQMEEAEKPLQRRSVEEELSSATAELTIRLQECEHQMKEAAESQEHSCAELLRRIEEVDRGLIATRQDYMGELVAIRGRVEATAGDQDQQTVRVESIKADFVVEQTRRSAALASACARLELVEKAIEDVKLSWSSHEKDEAISTTRQDYLVGLKERIEDVEEKLQQQTQTSAGFADRLHNLSVACNGLHDSRTPGVDGNIANATILTMRLDTLERQLNETGALDRSHLEASARLDLLQDEINSVKSAAKVSEASQVSTERSAQVSEALARMELLGHKAAASAAAAEASRGASAEDRTTAANAAAAAAASAASVEARANVDQGFGETCLAEALAKARQDMAKADDVNQIRTALAETCNGLARVAHELAQVREEHTLAITNVGDLTEFVAKAAASSIQRAAQRFEGELKQKIAEVEREAAAQRGEVAAEAQAILRELVAAGNAARQSNPQAVVEIARTLGETHESLRSEVTAKLDAKVIELQKDVQRQLEKSVVGTKEEVLKMTRSLEIRLQSQIGDLTRRTSRYQDKPELGTSDQRGGNIEGSSCSPGSIATSLSATTRYTSAGLTPKEGSPQQDDQALSLTVPRDIRTAAVTSAPVRRGSPLVLTRTLDTSREVGSVVSPSQKLPVKRMSTGPPPSQLSDIMECRGNDKTPTNRWMSAGGRESTKNLRNRLQELARSVHKTLGEFSTGSSRAGSRSPQRGRVDTSEMLTAQPVTALTSLVSSAVGSSGISNGNHISGLGGSFVLQQQQPQLRPVALTSGATGPVVSAAIAAARDVSPVPPMSVAQPLSVFNRQSVGTAYNTPSAGSPMIAMCQSPQSPRSPTMYSVGRPCAVGESNTPVESVLSARGLTSLVRTASPVRSGAVSPNHAQESGGDSRLVSGTRTVPTTIMSRLEGGPMCARSLSPGTDREHSLSNTTNSIGVPASAQLQGGRLPVNARASPKSVARTRPSETPVSSAGGTRTPLTPAVKEPRTPRRL
eukprot:TRINITY_DN27418_c0_g1_i1.p1 TRINITY_DN27418_c0_g1~~TRINITY_DN27418_c0_g1_i1.p1  ORF type:complete len:1116 (-),score=192.58 TRINITY_DN27418_c0_g1_i1:113-3460(-)